MLVGVAVMIASMPLTAVIARFVLRFFLLVSIVVVITDFGFFGGVLRYQTKLQRRQMKNKDKRTSIMSEILNNIRSIKLYAWENSFAAKLFAIRNDHELVLLR